MERFDIIDRIGSKYQTSNIEKGEFSYAKALKGVNKNIADYYANPNGTHHKFLDIRFENERLAILVETKDRFSNWKESEILEQLQEYVKFEKAFSDKKIVAILAETDGEDVQTWYGQSVIIDGKHKTAINTILSFEEYEDLCFGKVNDKIKVVDSIKVLNDKLHTNGIDEKLRSQFVGTCLLALKNGLVYKDVKDTIDKDGKQVSKQAVILRDIKSILEGLLAQSGSLNKAEKLVILNNKVLDDQDVISLTYDELKGILSYIDENIVPFINDKNTAGQDLLNLFFTTFNKYVGKSDKNQAFTPDHICDFMSKAVGVNKKSRVLDPCCGSGAFLVRAMTDAMDDCDTEKERDDVKSNQIFGIEYEDGAFGLSSTNMLIHGDGNSNVVKDSMFNRSDWIEKNNINIVLMNPPYNATKKCCDPAYTKKWKANKKEDPSKGLHFVEWVARHVSSNCKMAVLLPMQAAIGNTGDTAEFKKKMLANYTLDAVFSMPTDMFYPGASVVACCMIFDLSEKHEKANRKTFFGYYKDDKFIKRKGLGRVEITDENGESLWAKIEQMWLSLYKNKEEEPGLSVMKKVSWQDEWLAEAYLETDYSKLTDNAFRKTLRNHFSYLVKQEAAFSKDDIVDHSENESNEKPGDVVSLKIDTSTWKEFQIGKLFTIHPTKSYKDFSKKDLNDEMGTVPYVVNSCENNGIAGFSLLEATESGNMITFSDTTEGNTFFYQNKPFIGFAHVQGMYPIKKIKHEWTRNELLFLASVLTFSNDWRYNYGRKMTRVNISNSTVLLPCCNGDQPDWDFMNKYIDTLQKDLCGNIWTIFNIE